MSSSFEKYIKAAVESKKYDVVCEMAHVIYPDKHINIMTYPGNDVRVYKNREEEVQILCPKNISFVQESNLTKAIETGTIFDDADTVDNHAEFLVKTKMPTVAMANKGLENPYKLKEVVGSTIGVMNEDGDVDVSDTDVENGKNIIDDLLDKDSKEFKDVKNVVDDYLDNEDHEYGYDKDFTYDIQQLRDEIQQFKDADLSPEDSITDADWDDNWGSTSSIFGDHNEGVDDVDTDKDVDDIEVSDDDDSVEEDLSFEEQSAMMEYTTPAYKLNQNYFFESNDDTDIDYKMNQEACCNNLQAVSGGGNVNVTMEDDPNLVPKPVTQSGPEATQGVYGDTNTKQENADPIETHNSAPVTVNNTAGEPEDAKNKNKPENPSDLNTSPDTADTHAPVMGGTMKQESYQEGFGLLRPKKLKSIDIRSIVAYVTVEMNAIKDSNDQAMLAGYVCAKLELIDFYITVIDTHDERYVVPHSRQYLVDGQKQLSDLLAKILKIRPIDKSDRIWSIVTQ